MTPTLHRYNRGAIAGDYARAVAGLTLTGAPVLLLDPGAIMTTLLLAGVLLFAAFALRTAQRHLTAFGVTDDAIVAHGPFGGTLAWRDLRKIKLNYYSTRRDRGRGWMQLTLKGRGRTMRIESTMDGFDDIAARAAEAARALALPLTDATIENFAALGIVLDADMTMREAR